MKKLFWLALGALAFVAGPAPANHVEDVLGPGEPARSFPADFDLSTLPDDAQANAATGVFWTSKKIGGWGGQQPGDAATCTRVGGRRTLFLVHGTTEDASFWRASNSGEGTIINVRNYLLSVGWCPDQLWAISYTGAKGYFTANEINTPDLHGFVQAVSAYLVAKGTPIEGFDLVAHSLGVTVARRTAQLHTDLAARVQRFVALAGANHGTTACRGVGTLHGSHVCEEIEPGSAWLAQLNGPDGEFEDDLSPSLTMYSASPGLDQFYQGPDLESPKLKGACNTDVGPVAHNTIARGDPEVRFWTRFLLSGSCESWPQ